MKLPATFAVTLILFINLIDIEDIKYVINIDFPSQHEDYIHRIGRTARSTNSGIAYTLVTIENANKIPKLIEILRETGQEISRNLLDLAKRNQSFGGGSRGGNDRRGNFSNFYILLIIASFTLIKYN